MALLFYKDKLQAFKDEYLARRAKADEEIAKLRAEKAAIKAKFKSNMISQKKSQYSLNDLKAQINQIDYEVSLFWNRQEQTFDHRHITTQMLRDYINS